MWKICTALIIAFMACMQAQANAADGPDSGYEAEAVRTMMHCEEGYYRVNLRTQTMLYSLPLWDDGKPIVCEEGQQPDDNAVSTAVEAIKQHFRANDKRPS